MLGMAEARQDTPQGLEMQKQLQKCAPNTLHDVASQDNVAFVEECVLVPPLLKCLLYLSYP